MAHYPPAIVTPLSYAAAAAHAAATSPSCTSFSVRSSGHGHEAYAQAGPSSRANATGLRGPEPPSGYPCTTSVWMPPPLFNYSMSLPDAAHIPSTNKFPPYSYPQPQAYHLLAHPHPSSSTLTLDSLQPSTMAVPIPPRAVDPEEPLYAAAAPPRRESIDSSTSAEQLSPSPAEDTEHASAERKHACWMCHKAFDRPSTLRKHLLVHTGEKAFQCTTCGRRFSVQSNLNRHAKRCGARLANAQAAARAPTAGGGDSSLPSSEPTAATTAAVAPAPTPTQASAPAPAPAPAPTPTPAPASASALAPTPTSARARAPEAARVPAASASQSTFSASTLETLPPPKPSATRGRKRPSTNPNTTADSGVTDAGPKRKRRRRAPSPSRWVPDSLKTFDLTPYAKATPVPLPPVRPFHDSRNRISEERDSFDETASSTPYHPDGWNGRLPGPGLLEKEMNQMRGTLLVF